MFFNGIEIDLSKIDFDFSKPFYVRSTSKNRRFSPNSNFIGLSK